MKHAIIDLGSNTIRLSLYHIMDSQHFETLFSKKYMAGLAGYVENHVLTPDGVNQACAVLLDYRFLLRQLGMTEEDAIHVFATASLRNIKNTEEAVETIRRRTGLSVDVVSGEEEGLLGYCGALFTTPLKNGALFDIGGGSTELVQIRKGEVRRSQSIPIGSLNLFRGSVSKLLPNKAEQKEMRQWIQSEFSHLKFTGKAEQICCIGGTSRAVLKVANAFHRKEDDNTVITAKEFRKVFALLTARNTEARDYILKYCPDRVHTIVPGMMIMRELIRLLGGQELHISKYGVREGYLCRRFMQR